MVGGGGGGWRWFTPENTFLYREADCLAREEYLFHWLRESIRYIQEHITLAPHLRKVNKRCGAYSGKYGTKRHYYGFKRRPQISAAFLEKKFSKLRYISLICTV